MSQYGETYELFQDKKVDFTLLSIDCRRMGIRPQGGGERSRTIWNPEMDRYFIDLMLDQVRKGNRIDDHLFRKGAWKIMLSLFNAKFKYQFEKDVLKNRHKTLRNLYRAIQNLLKQKGFSWDEKRKMVTADNNVWDEYIKEHPRARFYRIKTIPYFSDLSMIYAGANLRVKDPHFAIDNQSQCTGSPSRAPNSREQCNSLLEASSHSEGKTNMNTRETVIQPSSCEASAEALHDILVDTEYRSSKAKGIIDDLPQPKSIDASCMVTRTRTYWQPPMDLFFIDIMLEQVKKGNQIDGLFKKQAWANMIASFNSRFGFNYEVDILKNRYKTLRRQYKVLKSILESDGFAWDEARQMVTADDSVWQDYIKVHVDARQYMSKPVSYYKELCVIFKELSSDENDSFSVQYLEENNENLQGSQSPVTLVSSDEQVDDEDESSRVGVEIAATDQKKHRHSGNPSTCAYPKKARTNDESMAHAIREMASAVSSLADKRKEDDSNCISIEHVIEAIQALPDMDEELILDACDLLEDEKKAKTFIALNSELRRKWLMRKLRPLQH